ncbi:hypothetical protein F511_09438 [Dorcoceras hygrometricum]|uniref:Uncharacterized protein n=1 Tax=Dorcoceras hygrometricum TaxID=472368 RepID=A0A2Z7BI79_9LAMI|nr:hypothetical protein F511_09438 [Dorcoceras hygrometricum]
MTTLLATRAWLRPVSRGNRHFTVDGGRLRQSGPRPDARLLRQPALEGLKRSAGRILLVKLAGTIFRRHKAAAAYERREGAAAKLRFRVRRVRCLVSRIRTPRDPLLMLNTLSLVSMRESLIQYLCDPQWFRDTASRGPTTIVAPESQSRTCPSDHVRSFQSILFRSDTTIGKSRVAIDPIAMHTSWRSNSDIASVTR